MDGNVSPPPTAPSSILLVWIVIMHGIYLFKKLNIWNSFLIKRYIRLKTVGCRVDQDGTTTQCPPFFMMFNLLNMSMKTAK